jgi:hypothetical protein
VVLRQVREYADVELDAVQSVLIQCMGRSFHHDSTNAAVREVAHPTRQLNRIGSGHPLGTGPKAFFVEQSKRPDHPGR